VQRSPLEIGADGFLLLDALAASSAPVAARELPMVQTLRDIWRVHYARDDRRTRWRVAPDSLVRLGCLSLAA
jgi:transposase